MDMPPTFSSSSTSSEIRIFHPRSFYLTFKLTNVLIASSTLFWFGLYSGRSLLRLILFIITLWQLSVTSKILLTKGKSNIKYLLWAPTRITSRNKLSDRYCWMSWKEIFYQNPVMQPGSKEISISRLRKVLPGFCQKFWSNFESNFPNDDIVHRAQSDVPDVSQNFFSTKYSSYWDFPSISEIIRIFPEYLWHADPPGTLSKLWHSYPGANSNQLANKENLFWKVLN